MIFEKNAKTGELEFSKSFLLMVLFADFDDLERVMMSPEVFNRSFNSLPDGQKIFQFT
jgi:hypothetical protein